MSDVAIWTEALTREFGERRAVDNLSLEVPVGSIFGFLGPNGAGKTTTIRLLLGLLEPTAGQARVLGFDIYSQSSKIRSQTGALLEAPGLYHLHTAVENLDLFARIARLHPGERRARIETVLRQFDLWERRHERVLHWSRGMRQRLAIARALLNRPPLIFLDEPTAGLDPAAAASLRLQIADLVATDGTTIFLTTHNLAEAEQLCSHLAIIDGGQLLAEGTPSELRSNSGAPILEVTGREFSERVIALLTAHPDICAIDLTPTGIRLELDTGASVPPIIALLVSEGVQIEEVRRGFATLEEIYLSLMGVTV